MTLALMLFEVPGLNLGAPKTESNKKAESKDNPKLSSNFSNKEKKHSSKGPLFRSNTKNKNNKDTSAQLTESSKPVTKSIQRETSSKVHKIQKNDGKSKLQQKMEEKLRGARFRYLNQKLYQSHSHEALNHFKEHPEDFEKYHEGFRSQVVHWPVNPVDLFIEQLDKEIKTKRQKMEVVDMGCGEAKILRHFLEDKECKNYVKVHSFDLAASHPEVVICDMTKVPLPDASVDVVIFCLSLMNTNFIDAIREAKRILKPKTGLLRIAEVESRFESGPHKFVSAVEELGFKKRVVNTEYKVFTLFEFIASEILGKTKHTCSKEDRDIILKPCLYKKR